MPKPHIYTPLPPNFLKTFFCNKCHFSMLRSEPTINGVVPNDKESRIWQPDLVHYTAMNHHPFKTTVIGQEISFSFIRIFQKRQLNRKAIAYPLLAKNDRRLDPACQHENI